MEWEGGNGDPNGDQCQYELHPEEPNDQAGATKYHPDVHILEIAKKAIEIPAAIVKMIEALDWFSDPIIAMDEGHAGTRLVNELKRMLCQAYAMSGGDDAPMYFERVWGERGLTELVALFKT
ncbi:hypothetical protein HY573_01565 [Candidatus Parcubacteria bacterium]|nr:hypothetical protein [Candidatus Parcubacteria bacterium]